MEGKSFRPVWSLLFAAGNVFSVVNWIRGEGIMMLKYVGWPEYVTIIFICTSGFIMLNWIWLYRFFPVTRFKEMEGLIQSIDQEKSSWDPKKRNLGMDTAKMYELSDRLDKLKIKHPYILDIDAMNLFIPALLSRCRQGRLKDARGLWEIMKPFVNDKEDMLTSSRSGNKIEKSRDDL